MECGPQKGLGSINGFIELLYAERAAWAHPILIRWSLTFVPLVRLPIATSKTFFSQARRKKLVTSTIKRPEVSGTGGVVFNLSAQSRNDVVYTPVVHPFPFRPHSTYKIASREYIFRVVDEKLQESEFQNTGRDQLAGATKFHAIKIDRYLAKCNRTLPFHDISPQYERREEANGVCQRNVKSRHVFLGADSMGQHCDERQPDRICTLGRI